MTESLKSVVRYTIDLGSRCFSWKMLSLCGPKDRMLLQLLVRYVTWSIVNDIADVTDIRLISLDTNQVSREDVCLLSFKGMNCRMKIVSDLRFLGEEEHVTL